MSRLLSIMKNKDKYAYITCSQKTGAKFVKTLNDLKFIQDFFHKGEN